MFGRYLERLRQACPVIHTITNYVTANDTANMLLAAGARPVMAEDPEEVAEITARCDGLTLNLGTLRTGVIPAMLAAGQQAALLHHPIVLDPVGAGSSRLRTKTARQLVSTLSPTVIRGNMSEILAIAGKESHIRGVDAADSDTVTGNTLPERADTLLNLSKQLSVILSVTGPIDLVTDGKRCLMIRNGRPEMGRVTGTGCQLSALTAAFLAANPEDPLEAAAAAVCLMGVAGETGWNRMQPGDGNIAYRGYIIDVVYNMTGEMLEKGENVELFTRKSAAVCSDGPELAQGRIPG